MCQRSDGCFSISSVKCQVVSCLDLQLFNTKESCGLVSPTFERYPVKPSLFTSGNPPEFVEITGDRHFEEREIFFKHVLPKSFRVVVDTKKTSDQIFINDLYNEYKKINLHRYYMVDVRKLSFTF